MSCTGQISAPRVINDNVRWRMRALRFGSCSPSAAKKMRDQCASDILFWVNTFCWTFDPRKDVSVIPFVTYPFQDDAILRIVDAIRDGRDIAIMKSRDMGASWINLLVIVWMWQFSHEMKNFLLVSRNESYVDGNPKSLFWKIDFLLDHQPTWLRPRLKDGNRTMMHIENPLTGSVIDGESTTGEVARGDRRTAILMDEFASFDVRSGYNAYAATQSATDCRIFNSTPKGVSNAFYDVTHNSSAEILKMHWSEHPVKAAGLYSSSRDPKTGKMTIKRLDTWTGRVEVRTKGQAGRKIVNFPEDYPFVLDGKIRSPWYDLQCERAITSVEIAQELDIDFQGSDYSFFDPIAVERYKDNYCFDPRAVGDVEVSDDGQSVLKFVPSQHGRISFFESPAKNGRWDADRQFVMGVDVSAGTGASNSTVAVYDVKTTEKVAEYANPNILPDDFGRYVIALSKWFNSALVVPDRSGPTGEVFVTRITTDAPEVRLYRPRDQQRVGAPVTNKQGVYLNAKTRTEILTRYRDAIGHVSIINRSASAMSETLRFICKTDGTIEHSSAGSKTDPSGARTNHGDMVIADALANLALSEGSRVDDPNDVEREPGTLAWRMEIAKKSEMSEDEFGLDEGWSV